MRLKPRFSKGIRKRASAKWPIVAAIAIIAACILIPAMQTEKEVEVSQLLSTIAKGESRGNYNAYYGNAGNTATEFTAMSVGQVLAWQSDYVKQGSPSSAVGRYQFVRPTLNGLVKELKIDKEAKFTTDLQDQLAIALLQRRGLNDYARGKITREQFAHNLSKEWAALPRIIGEDPSASYYAGDGLNKVQVSIDDINKGIDSLLQSP